MCQNPVLNIKSLSETLHLLSNIYRDSQLNHYRNDDANAALHQEYTLQQDFINRGSLLLLTLTLEGWEGKAKARFEVPKTNLAAVLLHTGVRFSSEKQMQFLHDTEKWDCAQCSNQITSFIMQNKCTHWHMHKHTQAQNHGDTLAHWYPPPNKE